jgi:hypothetical protein
MLASKTKKETKEVRPSPVEEIWIDLEEQKALEPFKVPLMMLQEMWDMGRKREVHQGLFLLQQKLR